MHKALLALAALSASDMAQTPARAGLYYSGETFAELPSQWRGFLLDQRLLRTCSVKPAGKAPPNPARARYEAAAGKLAKAVAVRKLTPDEAADLGALYVRLGDVGRALEVLRPAQRAHPAHFRLAANLGTAWQLHGDLTAAAATLGQAVRLAPEKFKKAEALHLKLVRLRARARGGSSGPDDLFGVRFVGPSGKYEPGQLAAEQRKRLPANAVALVQQLALALPADGRLLWLLAELAGAHGDLPTAAAILDGCVTEFGLRASDLLAHRRAVRAAAGKVKAPGVAAGHGEHAVAFKPRSPRPLLRKTMTMDLPPIDAKGVNPLPWSVVGETTVDRRYRPTFPKYLKQLDGKRVVLRGYMQPLRDEDELSDFLLIEYPVGCWYCEQPDMVNIVLVELPAGKTRGYVRGQVRVSGKLVLNATDPENFLYILRDAKVAGGE